MILQFQNRMKMSRETMVINQLFFRITVKSGQVIDTEIGEKNADKTCNGENSNFLPVQPFTRRVWMTEAYTSQVINDRFFGVPTPVSPPGRMRPTDPVMMPRVSMRKPMTTIW